MTMSQFTPFRNPCGAWLVLLVLPLACASSSPVLAQDSLPLSALPTDPPKASERQNATRQTLAEQRLAIEQLRGEIARLNLEQPARMQALSGATASTALVEQARLDSDALRLKQEELQTSIASAKRQIKTLQETIPALEAQEQLLKNPARDGPEFGNRAKQLAQLRVVLEQSRTDLQLEQKSLKTLEEWLTLVEQRQVLAGQWRARLEQIHLQQQAQGRQEARQDLAIRLEREQQAQLGKTEELRAHLQQQGQTLSGARRAWLEAEIQAAEERAKLLRLDIRLAAMNEMSWPTGKGGGRQGRRFPPHPGRTAPIDRAARRTAPNRRLGKPVKCRRPRATFEPPLPIRC